MEFSRLKNLLRPADTKIVLLVIDGLGGANRDPQSLTEAAHTPHLDDIAAAGLCGLQLPLTPGITPGSGPAHLALLGYDPYGHPVGRGVLAALGSDFPLIREPRSTMTRNHHP